MIKRTILALFAVVALSACTPEEALWWDGYHGKEPGTTARELCREDPWGNKGLCPYPAASDSYSTWIEPWGDGHVVCYPEGWPHSIPEENDPCDELPSE